MSPEAYRDGPSWVQEVAPDGFADEGLHHTVVRPLVGRATVASACAAFTLPFSEPLTDGPHDGV
ncbi:MAG TPA: hypothetical protein VH913_25825 [Hyphomicrobiaceae bacterium]